MAGCACDWPEILSLCLDAYIFLFDFQVLALGEGKALKM
jgi:hypothetical protein